MTKDFAKRCIQNKTKFFHYDLFLKWTKNVTYRMLRDVCFFLYTCASPSSDAKYHIILEAPHSCSWKRGRGQSNGERYAFREQHYASKSSSSSSWRTLGWDSSSSRARSCELSSCLIAAVMASTLAAVRMPSAFAHKCRECYTSYLTDTLLWSSKHISVWMTSTGDFWVSAPAELLHAIMAKCSAFHNYYIANKALCTLCLKQT